MMQVSTNGLISFGLSVPFTTGGLFYATNINQYDVVAPYWIDNDASLNGIVSWQIHNSGDSILSDDIIHRVSNFIRMNTNSTNFNGKYVFIGNWSEMNKYPAASNLDRVRLSYKIILQVLTYTHFFHRTIRIKLYL